MYVKNPQQMIGDKYLNRFKDWPKRKLNCCLSYVQIDIKIFETQNGIKVKVDANILLDGWPPPCHI